MHALSAALRHLDLTDTKTAAKSAPALPDVPIRGALDELRAALRAHPNAVLEAPPGAGKSTVVPLALLGEPWFAAGRQRILMLQPRRVAARAVARRMAATLGEEPGATVGFRTRLESRSGPATRIEVVTEGILTRRLQHDPALEDVAAVLFDEFHERSLQSDLGLALALDAQRHLRPDLRLLVMSATLDGTAVAELLGAGTPVVRSAGRAYDVTTHYVAGQAPATAGSARPWPEPIELRAARLALRALEAHPDGDALVFLPGAGEIRRACAALEREIAAGSTGPRLGPVRVVPLYGELDSRAQDAALQPAPAGVRKVIVATNVAETSLTIEGVRIVIDGGLERRSRFDPATGMNRLVTVAVARASADQRRGRAGRTAPGVCYRLWSESTHASLSAQAPPEITEADLAPLALELACWGADPHALSWLDPPPLPMLQQARELLQRLEALDARGLPTPAGRRMAALGAHPRLAHMIERARPLHLTALACDIAALLTERDPLRPSGPGLQRDPDLRHALDVLHGAQPPAGHVADGRAIEAIRRSAELLQQRVRRADTADSQHAGAPDAPERDAAVGLLLAFAYPDRIGLARSGEPGRYLLSGGRGATLSSSTALARSELIVAAELDAGEREARILRAAPLERSLLEAHLGHAIVTRDEIRWDERSAAIVARRVRECGALVLDERPLADAKGDSVLPAMLEGVRRLGLASLPWSPELRQWQARVELVRQCMEGADNDWPDLSDAALLASLEQWLAPYLMGVTRREHLSRVDLRSALHGLLDWNRRRSLDELAPTHVVVPSGSRVAVDYLGAAPALAVRLQEVFGWAESPRILGGRMPITLELLSPARRPVQVTRDLASFWARGYAEVRKDLRGRYPRHYWPEDPYSATATRKVRPRGE